MHVLGFDEPAAVGKEIVGIQLPVAEVFVRQPVKLVATALGSYDDSRSGATWRGKIRRVSDWYGHRRSIWQEPLQFNDVRTLEGIIELEPGQPPLRIGQRVLVQVLPSDSRAGNRAD